MSAQNKLKEIYNYDDKTGVFTFKIRRGPKKIGDLAGCLTKDGYVVMKFEGKSHFAHRLAWLYVTGNWPEGLIDHKDTIRNNNRFDNLRVVNYSVSNRNRNKSKTNKSGTIGVCWDKWAKSWRAYICVDCKIIELGRYKDKEDAIFARMTAEKKYDYWVDKAKDCI